MNGWQSTLQPTGLTAKALRAWQSWETSSIELPQVFLPFSFDEEEQIVPARAIKAPEFRGAAKALQSHRGPVVVIGGPAETGKTYAAVWYLDRFLRDYAGAQGAMVRKVRVTIAPTVLRTYLRIQAMYGTAAAKPYGGNSPIWFDYSNGSRLWIGGMDDPGKVLSGERDIIYVNQFEELDEADAETLTTRVTGRGSVAPYTVLVGDCNPSAEDHYIVRRRDAGVLDLLESRHEDNPTLYNEPALGVFVLTEQGRRTMTILDALTGVRRQRLRNGLWVGAEGAYFTQLDEAIHLVEYERLPYGWPVWAALDYGFAHPLSFGVFMMDPRGRVVLLGRHAAHHWYIAQHVRAMDELLGLLGVRKEGLRVVAGHDCWSKGHDDIESIADKFWRHGYQLERANISRVIGWRAIGERLGNPAVGVPPALFFNKRYGGQAVFNALARMKHDPNNEEDVLKVNADAEGRGGDDDPDMLRYGGLAAPVSGWGAAALGALSSGRRV